MSNYGSRREYWRIEKAAEEYSKETFVNELKQEGFLNGVKWCVESLLERSKEDFGPYNIDSGTKKYLEKLSLEDVRSFVKDAMEVCIIEESESE